MRGFGLGASALALFVVLSIYSGCAGTRGTNPVEPATPSNVATFTVEVGAYTNASVSSLSVCMTELTFVGSGSTSSTSVTLPAQSLTLGSGAASLGSISVPKGDYDRVESKLSSGCPGGASVSYVNGATPVQSTDTVTAKFTGGFNAASTTQKLQLEIQPIVNQLASVTNGAQIKTAVESTSGAVRPIETFTWTGAGGDQNWSNAANWYGNAIPGSQDRALFDSTCGSNNTVQLDIPVTVAQISMGATFAGSIFQNGSNTVTVAKFDIAGGTFYENNGAISITQSFTQTGGDFRSSWTLASIANFTMSGGTFRASPGTTDFTGNFNGTGGTFNQLSGTARYLGSGPISITTGPLQLSTFRFETTGAVTFIDDFHVNNLTLAGAGGTYNGAPIHVKLDLAVDASAGGTSPLIIEGSQIQTMTQASGAVIPGSIFTVNKTANSLSLGGNVSFSSPSQALDVTMGSVLNMAGHSLSISGALTNNGTINRGGGTLTYGSLSGAGTIN